MLVEPGPSTRLFDKKSVLLGSSPRSYREISHCHSTKQTCTVPFSVLRLKGRVYGNANNGSMGFHRVVAIDFTGIMIHVRNQFRFSSRGTDALSKNAARVCAQAAFCSMQASSSDCRFFRQSAAPGLSLPPPQRRHRERADYNRGFMLLPHRCHPLCSNASRSMATASRWPLLFNRNTVTRCFLRPVIASTDRSEKNRRNR